VFVHKHQYTQICIFAGLGIRASLAAGAEKLAHQVCLRVCLRDGSGRRGWGRVREGMCARVQE